MTDTHDISVTTICKNGTWEYTFNKTMMCVRKYYFFEHAYKKTSTLTKATKFFRCKPYFYVSFN